MAGKSAAGNVRKVHLGSCNQRQICTCGGRGQHTEPCPKATRCRCDGRWQARITAPNGAVIKAPSTFRAKVDAEGWVEAERRMMEDPTAYVPAQERIEIARKKAEREAANTFAVYAERYLSQRPHRPKTAREYRRLLNTALLPAFGDIPIATITREMVQNWHSSLAKNTPAGNAATYRFLHSILAAAEDEELIDRNPARIAKAANAKVQRKQVPASVDEIATIVDAMPERLRLFIVLAAFAGMRSGEIFELRCGDLDSSTGAISVTRKIEKDADPTAPGACPNCGRVIGEPKTEKGTRVVHLPTPFLPLLRAHLLAHTAPGADGLLFPGDRKDHMSMRYLHDRYDVARTAAGRPDLTIHGLRHSGLTLAGQMGATNAELLARAGHSSLVAMAIYQHATADRDRMIADRLGESITASQAWEGLLNET